MAVFQLSQHSWDGWPLPLCVQSEIPGTTTPCGALPPQTTSSLPLPASAVSLLLRNEMLIIEFCVKPAGLESQLDTSQRRGLNWPESFKSFLYFQPPARCYELHPWVLWSASCSTAVKLIWAETYFWCWASFNQTKLIIMHLVCGNNLSLYSDYEIVIFSIDSLKFKVGSASHFLKSPLENVTWQTLKGRRAQPRGVYHAATGWDDHRRSTRRNWTCPKKKKEALCRVRLLFGCSQAPWHGLGSRKSILFYL